MAPWPGLAAKGYTNVDGYDTIVNGYDALFGWFFIKMVKVNGLWWEQQNGKELRKYTHQWKMALWTGWYFYPFFSLPSRDFPLWVDLVLSLTFFFCFLSLSPSLSLSPPLSLLLFCFSVLSFSGLLVSWSCHPLTPRRQFLSKLLSIILFAVPFYNRESIFSVLWFFIIKG